MKCGFWSCLVLKIYHAMLSSGWIISGAKYMVLPNWSSVNGWSLAYRHYIVKSPYDLLVYCDEVTDSPKNNQSSERPARSESFKLKPVQILLFFFDSQLTGLIIILQNTAITKHFTKATVYTRKPSGTIFCSDVWINGGQVIFQ